MKRTYHHERSFRALMAAIISAALAGACNGSPQGVPDEHEEAPIEVEGSAALLDAGAESAALGVTAWKIENGVAQGLDEESEIVAEFLVDGDAQEVKAILPGDGSRMLDGSMVDTLSPRAAALLDALWSDLDNVAEASVREDPVDHQETNKAGAWGVYGCYAFHTDCEVVGFRGILNGSWRNYLCRTPTAYCSGRNITGFWQN